MACSNPTTLIRCCCLLSPIVVLFVILAFATDHWVEEDVNWSKLNELNKKLANQDSNLGRYHHSRHRGLLRECYPKSISKQFLESADNVVDDECFYLDFSNPKGVDISFEYQRRMDMMRSTLALYVFALVGVVITLFISFLLCCVKHTTITHIGAIVSILSGFLVLASIVLFHATEYVEGNEDGAFGEMPFQNTWSKRLRLATDSELGWSYACAWVGFILAIFNGTLFLFLSRALRRHFEKYGSEFSDTDSTYSSSDRDAVVKHKTFQPPRKGEHMYYDNQGMMMPVGYPMVLDANTQALPAIPAMEYGNQFYHLNDRNSSIH